MTDEPEVTQVDRDAADDAWSYACDAFDLYEAFARHRIATEAKIRADQIEREWQPIETAPKDGTEIIVTDGYEVWTAKHSVSNIRNYAPFFATTCNGRLWYRGPDWCEEREYFDSTHWMPLPAPPEKHNG